MDGPRSAAQSPGPGPERRAAIDDLLVAARTSLGMHARRERTLAQLHRTMLTITTWLAALAAVGTLSEPGAVWVFIMALGAAAGAFLHLAIDPAGSAREHRGKVHELKALGGRLQRERRTLSLQEVETLQAEHLRRSPTRRRKPLARGRHRSCTRGRTE